MVTLSASCADRPINCKNKHIFFIVDKKSRYGGEGLDAACLNTIKNTTELMIADLIYMCIYNRSSVER